MLSVNLGQNDYWFGVGPKVTEAYVELAQALREVHPRADIFMTLGDMVAASPESPYPGYLRDAVTQLRTAHGDTAVHMVLFEYEGSPIHPTVERHEDMAEVLIDAIGIARPEFAP